MYFELSAAVLNVPPLRDRAEDIPQIIQILSNRFSEEINTEKVVEDEAVVRLQAYEWPGNIRELEVILKRMFLTGQYSRLTAAVVAEEIGRAAKRKSSAAPHVETNLTDMFSEHIKRYFTATGDASPIPGLHGRILAEIEKPLIIETLYHTAGNQIKAANILGLNRNTLRKKIKELSIPSSRDVYRKRRQEGP